MHGRTAVPEEVSPVALPDFLVIGAPKAGTTALHAALAAHPGLFMSPIKEPKFFLTDGPPPVRGGGPGDVQTYREHVWRRTDYEALFAAAPAGTLRGESTPFYLYDRAAQRRIGELIPHAKMIVILRDPVERAHSNWTHLWSAGLEPVSDFVRACAEEDARVAAGWAPFWHYTRLGRYAEQLEHLFLRFPREQVFILRYRALLDTPALALDDICEFLGVHPGIVAHVPRENVTAQPPARSPTWPCPSWPGAPPWPGGTCRARRAPPCPGRWSASCSRTRAGASRCPGSSARPCCPTSRTTSGSSSGSPAPTSATGCGRGSVPAGWSAPGRPGSRRPATASPASDGFRHRAAWPGAGKPRTPRYPRSSVRSSWAPSGRVIS